MATQLPLTVSCIALAHILDDRDAVEGYLNQDPAVSECFPVILRDFMNTESENAGVSKHEPIPNAETTLHYLLAFWSSGDTLLNAARYGATYLIQHIIDSMPSREWISSDKYDAQQDELMDKLTLALVLAAQNGHAETIELLEDLGAQDTATHAALHAAIDGKHIAATIQLTDQYNVIRSIERAIPTGNIPMLKTLAENDINGRILEEIQRLIMDARLAGQYDVAEWLAHYH